MKKSLFTSLLILWTIIGFAQKTSITVSIANSKAEEFSLLDTKQIFQAEFPEPKEMVVNLNKKKLASLNLELKRAGFFGLRCMGRTDREYLFYNLYIEPGNQLNIKIDFKRPDFGITVIGKGAENNQPSIALIKKTFSVQEFYGDTTPTRVISAIKKEEIRLQQNFDNYVKKYKPTKKFIADWRLNQRYFAAETYFSFKENNKFKIQGSHSSTMLSWEKIQDSLINEKSINNELAVYTPNYLSLIQEFLLRKKEKLWMMASDEPENFFREWYNMDQKEGMIAYSDDATNLLEEKIINKYFSGQSAEILYITLFNDAIDESYYKNVPQIFDRFKSHFPKSKYINWIKPYVEAYLIREQKPLNDKMIIEKNNGSDLNTFEEVLAIHKGKTMLLDMWGTWCGPCRSELETNGQAIKYHFKDKGVDYLYIANHDQNNESDWKKLIPYFNMEGFHILANLKLTKDIMQKVKGNGFPTYVIIKKDGTYELSKAGYPMNREILIKQLEEALAH
ncbi:TlpA family protein disulfide reductase [Pedobacter sp. KBS0701]|uniref:TlpA family protein disulfide reductase n=2 Tax=unclassified Pedobacter TaxID=2628915 RepID=UPI00110EB595|nr:TlpA disulfide reductase family protein [Pedobacter sp. KBS0701]QDW23547.1 TlpA family protein disulfide reductase [Pedobacter sp. KBS0701]